ncbi:unnamed protein product [Schistosoma curassoni]|uniref:TBP-binding domain-containing protein n=1 Tax=Schistosoma curassoni TaxID=6186 RepID=A0A183JYD4_9TREM|nr:unnamed protein product [Schistosoma curassoni]
MQNKLLDLNGKSSSYFLDDIDNDKHGEYDKNNHEYLAYHPVIPASTIVNLHRQTILQNFMDSWLDPDEESEHNDNSNSIYDHNNNNQSEEKDQVKTPDIHIGVPGPLGEMYFHNNIDSDDDFFNGRDNEDDEKDENDELEEGKDNIHSRGYFNIEEDDDDDDDEEDLKSPIQIKQQHSSKQSIINTSSSTPLLHNDSNKLTGGCCSPCEPLVSDQGFSIPLDGLSVSTNTVKTRDIRFSSSQFRKQHFCRKKAVTKTSLAVVLCKWRYESISRVMANSPHSRSYRGIWRAPYKIYNYLYIH